MLVCVKLVDLSKLWDEKCAIWVHLNGLLVTLCSIGTKTGSQFLVHTTRWVQRQDFVHLNLSRRKRVSFTLLSRIYVADYGMHGDVVEANAQPGTCFVYGKRDRESETVDTLSKVIPSIASWIVLQKNQDILRHFVLNLRNLLATCCRTVSLSRHHSLALAVHFAPQTSTLYR